MYEIRYDRKVVKNLEKLPKKEKRRIFRKIESLAENPRPEGMKALQKSHSGYCRVRCGDYRIVYTVQDDQLFILVIKIAHRKDVYKLK